MEHPSLPTRVRVLILGGGIHGVGVLHDLASRGWRDVLLLERHRIGSGTSSRSTKLIHGGLRYLRNVRDFPLVGEALYERRVLMALAPDLVHPLKLFLPVLKKGGMPGPILRMGLWLYDILARRARIHSYAKETFASLRDEVPVASTDKFKDVYSFWDAQTDDLSLVRRVAYSARALGADFREGAEVVGIAATDDGWQVTMREADGKERQISALYVVNALGPWANLFLEANKLKPVYRGVNSEGAHIIVRDLGLKAGLFLQDPGENRIFFVLPWLGKTLIGTTEALFADNPDSLTVRSATVTYLLNRANENLNITLNETDILARFAGLRWLALDDQRDLSNTSRSYALGEHQGGRGILMTLYGGKLTTYRSLAKTIGDRIARHFGDSKPSRTHEAATWIGKDDMPPFEATMLDRFAADGVAHDPSSP